MREREEGRDGAKDRRQYERKSMEELVEKTKEDRDEVQRRTEREKKKWCYKYLDVEELRDDMSGR